MGYTLFIDANNPLRQLERAGATPEAAREQLAQMLSALPTDMVPNVAALRAYFEGEIAESAVFDEGLEFLIDAARARIEAAR